jgi:hypothetical protein
MAAIVDDIHKAAEWIARALKSSGYMADFSPGSLWEIDRFFDEHSEKGQAKKGSLLASEVGARIFALGAYVGEVVRRHKGGEWAGDDNDPQVEVNVELRLPGGKVSWPMQRVMKRFKNGAEDGIAAWGAALDLDLGKRPEPPRPLLARESWIRRGLGFLILGWGIFQLGWVAFNVFVCSMPAAQGKVAFVPAFVGIAMIYVGQMWLRGR